MKILYLDGNGKTVIPVEGVRGIKLVKSSANDIFDWSWKYKLYEESIGGDRWHYIPFKSLLAFFDSQGTEDYYIYDYRDFDERELVMGKDLEGIDEYTKDVL